MDRLELHALALVTFTQALARTGDAALDTPTCCPGWDVRALIEHVIDGNRRVQVRGGRAPLPADPPSGDASIAVLAGHVLMSGGGAHDVFAEPGGLTRRYPLPVGEVSGEVFAELRCLDLLTHAWDLGDAIGRVVEVAADVAESALAAAHRVVTPALRQPGVFGEAQPCDPGRPPLDRLAAFLGRDVDGAGAR